MTSSLDRLRQILGPDWGDFVVQFDRDLRAQRAAITGSGGSETLRRAAHCIAALAGTAGEEALAAAARRVCDLGALGEAAELLAPVDLLIARIAALAGQAGA